MPARKHLARREPSGRISRAVLKALDPHSPATVKRLMDASLRGVAATPEYGTELGRLALTNKIDARQFEAGKRWHRLREEVARALCIPMPANSISALRFSRPGTNPRDEFERAVLMAFEDALVALRRSGNDSIRAVVRICEYDQACTTADQLKSLAVGLDALALHWHLTK